MCFSVEDSRKFHHFDQSFQDIQMKPRSFQNNSRSIFFSLLFFAICNDQTYDHGKEFFNAFFEHHAKHPKIQ